jgi:hypothetical protein
LAATAGSGDTAAAGFLDIEVKKRKEENQKKKTHLNFSTVLSFCRSRKGEHRQSEKNHNDLEEFNAKQVKYFTSCDCITQQPKVADMRSDLRWVPAKKKTR